MRVRGMAVRAGMSVIAMVASFGPTPDAEAALPLEDHTCNDPITHSFRLEHDILGCGAGEDGLNVGKSGITIDLGGHRIEGAGSGLLTGIDLTGNFDNVVVRNGTIEGFGSAVHIGLDSAGNTIAGLVGVNQSASAFTIEGDRNRIRGNIVAKATSYGAYIPGHNNVLTGNVFARTVGVYSLGIGQVLRANTVSGGQFGGMTIYGPATVVGNMVLGNGSYGIDALGDAMLLKSNLIAGNAGDGIVLNTGDHKVLSNKIVGNADDGIQIYSGTPYIANNTVSANGYPGTAGSGLGIHAGAVAVNGSGNAARGNDDDTECDAAGLCLPPKHVRNLPVITPVCGVPITKSGQLASDLTCSGDGLVIGKSGITIDLAGHKVVGDGDIGDFGVFNPGFNGVRVRNGIVRNFQDGVRTDAGTNAMNVARLTVVGNSGDGLEMRGFRHTVASNVVAGNDIGIFLDPSGAGAGSTIKRNNTSNNALGMLFNAGMSHKIRSNVAAGNQSFGIGFTAGSLHKLIANTVGGNAAGGIDLDGAGDRLTVKKNFVAGNGDNGIRTEGTKNSLAKNRVYGNGADGILGEPSVADQPSVNANVAHANGFDDGTAGAGLGIDMTGTNASGAGNLARGNDDADQCAPATLC